MRRFSWTRMGRRYRTLGVSACAAFAGIAVCSADSVSAEPNPPMSSHAESSLALTEAGPSTQIGPELLPSREERLQEQIRTTRLGPTLIQGGQGRRVQPISHSESTGTPGLAMMLSILGGFFALCALAVGVRLRLRRRSPSRWTVGAEEVPETKREYASLRRSFFEPAAAETESISSPAVTSSPSPTPKLVPDPDPVLAPRQVPDPVSLPLENAVGVLDRPIASLDSSFQPDPASFGQIDDSREHPRPGRARTSNIEAAEPPEIHPVHLPIVDAELDARLDEALDLPEPIELDESEMEETPEREATCVQPETTQSSADAEPADLPEQIELEELIFATSEIPLPSEPSSLWESPAKPAADTVDSFDRLEHSLKTLAETVEGLARTLPTATDPLPAVESRGHSAFEPNPIEFDEASSPIETQDDSALEPLTGREPAPRFPWTEQEKEGLEPEANAWAHFLESDETGSARDEQGRMSIDTPSLGISSEHEEWPEDVMPEDVAFEDEAPEDSAQTQTDEEEDPVRTTSEPETPPTGPLAMVKTLSAHREHRVSDPPESNQDVESEESESVEATDPVARLAQTREQVLELAGRGIREAEICEQVGLGRGEVSLILKSLFRDP